MSTDFTDRGFGIRVANRYCVVIEKKSGVNGWVEDGQRHPLPLPVDFDSIQAIPSSRVAIAFKTYELAHPRDGLRALLTQKPDAPEGGLMDAKEKAATAWLRSIVERAAPEYTSVRLEKSTGDDYRLEFQAPDKDKTFPLTCAQIEGIGEGNEVIRRPIMEALVAFART